MAGPSSLRIACLQVAVAAFSFLLGTVILVAPDQLAGWPNSVFQARLPLWGVSFLLVSTGLFAIGAIGLPAPLAQATHLLAGALLLVLGGTVVPGSLPSGVVGWGVVGIGTALAPALARLRLPFPPTAGNLLPLLAGVANVGLGVVVLAGYSGMAGALPWCGAGLLASGGFLVAAS